MIRPTNVPVAVDLIVFNQRNEVLLVERRNEPKGWALPGGFVEAGESVYDAAVRELGEETGLKTLGPHGGELVVGQQFHCYSAPGRDPRGPVVSVVFTAEVIGDAEVKGGDDAKDAMWFPLADVGHDLAFDHSQILSDFIQWRLTGQRPPAHR